MSKVQIEEDGNWQNMDQLACPNGRNQVVGTRLLNYTCGYAIK